MVKTNNVCLFVLTIDRSSDLNRYFNHRIEKKKQNFSVVFSYGPNEKVTDIFMLIKCCVFQKGKLWSN